MDLQVILQKLDDLRANWLPKEVYEKLKKMIDCDLYEPYVVYSYLDALVTNSIITDEQYDQLMDIFSDDGLTLDDEIPFY